VRWNEATGSKSHPLCEICGEQFAKTSTDTIGSEERHMRDATVLTAL
jgi:hypothetical protein